MKKILLFLLTAFCLTACGNPASEADDRAVLQMTESLPLSYADQFSVDFYEEGYTHIYVADGTDYVLVPEGKTENSLGYDSPVYIQKSSDSIYLAASSAMDLFLELNRLDVIKACSTKAGDFAMPEVKKAIEEESIVYVGKYSAPDYETLLNLHCNLAIESTMIGHSPQIKEQLERIGIPVFVERSSYESNPLGRLEWIKLYGVLTDTLEEAEAFYETELSHINELENASETPKTVAFFSVSSNGYITVRKPGDYICKMIEMAGGEYALKDLPVEEENAMSTVNIGMEEFYRLAKDADILLYNGSIDGGIGSVRDLLNKNELLGDFKAVRENAVWGTGLNMFQESSKIVEVVRELADILADENSPSQEYIKHLE